MYNRLFKKLSYWGEYLFWSVLLSAPWRFKEARRHWGCWSPFGMATSLGRTHWGRSWSGAPLWPAAWGLFLSSGCSGHLAASQSLPRFKGQKLDAAFQREKQEFADILNILQCYSNYFRFRFQAPPHDAFRCKCLHTHYFISMHLVLTWIRYYLLFLLLLVISSLQRTKQAHSD